MRIGLDFGGVIDQAPQKWAELINNSEHEFFLVSHCIAMWDLNMREHFCEQCKIHNLSFIHDPRDESHIMHWKAILVSQNNIELYVDDYKERCDSIKALNPNCHCLYSPPEKVNETIEYIKNLK